jgi:hypothetical protein
MAATGFFKSRRSSVLVGAEPCSAHNLEVEVIEIGNGIGFEMRETVSDTV